MEVERLTAVLEASGLASYRANMAAADRYTASTRDKLGALAEISRVATDALAHVKVTATQALESEAAVNRIKSSVSGVTRVAMDAADRLEKVKLGQAQASESTVSGDRIDRKLKDITGNANEARRALESVRLAGAGAGGGRSGVGVGPFGSGFGRIGLLGAAVGGGALLGPAAGPGALGLLAAIPGLATTGAGALGALMLAFNGVGKAIGGDKKAYDSLTASQQQFVMQVRSLDGFIDHLKQTSAGAMFPGLTQGLHSALSPGTVGAITEAIQHFGAAIGVAGAQWGQYFGSSQFVSVFGPLMHAGANNLTLMSHAALSLFDALGVLGRAAIPLTTWLTTQAAVGSKWVDTWLRAKDATGGLSGALREAQSSLALVGNLVAALWHAVIALGTALYPVSKVAVKDLTDGLNGLAQIIDHNQTQIRTFISGALQGFVDTIRTAVAVGGVFVHVLQDIANGINALLGPIASAHTAIEAFMLVFVLRKVVALDALASIASYLLRLGSTARTAGTTTSTGLMVIENGAASATTKVGGLRSSLLSLGSPQVLLLLAAAAAAVKVIYDTFQGTATASNVFTKGNPYAKGSPNYLSYAAGTAGRPEPNAGSVSSAAYQAGIKNYTLAHGGFGGFGGNTFGARGFTTGAGVDIKDENAMIPIALSALARQGYAVNVTSGYRTYDQQAALYARYVKSGFNQKYIAAKPGTSNHETGNAVDVYVNGRPVDQSSGALAILKKYGLVADVAGDHEHLDYLQGGGGSSPFGTPPPFTKNLGPKPKKPPLIPVAMTNAASTYANLAKNLSNTGGQAKQYLDNELIVLTKEDQLLRTKLAGASGANKDTIEKALTGVENKMRDVGTLIGNAIVITGAALLPDKLKLKLKSLAAQGTADADYGAVFVGAAAENYAKTIRDNLLNQGSVLNKEIQNLKAQLAGANSKQRAAIKTEITSVTTQLKSVQDQVVQSLQGTVQALQSRVQGYFATVQQDLESALGAKFFQNGLKSPLEQQLADMQAQDQLGSLQDALKTAKDQLANDQSTLAAVIFDAATGSTSYAYNKAQQDQLDLDNKAVTAAQRQLDEYDLSIRAAQERTQVDQDYSVQVRSLDEQLAALADQFANGTGSMASLSGIAAQYGIQLSGTAIPDLNNLSVASKALGAAMADLAEYITKITGKTPAAAPTGAAPGAPDFSSSTGGGTAIDYAQAAQAAAEAMGSAGTYTVSGGSVYYQSNTGTYGKKPMLDEGGWVEKTGVAVVHAGETYSGVGSKRMGGGPMTVELHVHALDPASVNWDDVAPKVRDAFVRMAKSGAQNPWG